MAEERKNGSPSGKTGGTVTNPSVSNNITSLPLYQGYNYAGLEYAVVLEIVERLRSAGRLNTVSLAEVANDIQQAMKIQIAFLNSPTNLGGRGFRWPSPKTISPVQCALFILERETIRLVCTKEEVKKATPSGVLAVYQRDGEFEGIYRELGNYQIAQWATEFAGAVNQKWRTEFQAAITDNAKPVCECENPDYIFFKSEILDYETKERIPFSPDIVSMRKMPFDLPMTEPDVPKHIKPDGTVMDFWDWIDSLVPYDGGRDLLIKLLGAVVRHNYVWRIMVTLFNPTGKNGKSTFLRLLKACVGIENVMISTMSQLCDDRFGLAKLPGAILVTCEDSDAGTYIRSTSRIKCIISHDPVSVERKGQDTFNYKPNCMIVSASNELPKTKDKSFAWQDRNYYVPFTGDFRGQVEDKTISSEWVVSTGFCQYALYQALIKWDNYYTLPEPQKAIELKQEFMSENDSVIEFLEWFEDRGTLDFIPNGYAWYKYRPWMQEHRPNTQLPTEKSFVKHFAEVALATGRWVQPKENDGYCRRFLVSAWCQCKDQIHEYDVLQKSSAYSRGIVRKEVWDYCQKHHVTPKDMNIKDYDAMRKQYGIIRTGDMTAENSHSNVIQFKQM